LTPYVSQGSAATDLRGDGSFNSSFPPILSEFNSEKYENESTFAEVIEIKVARIC